jgi:hypothetical protein
MKQDVATAGSPGNSHESRSMLASQFLHRPGDGFARSRLLIRRNLWNRAIWRVYRMTNKQKRAVSDRRRGRPLRPGFGPEHLDSRIFLEHPQVVIDPHLIQSFYLACNFSAL